MARSSNEINSNQRETPLASCLSALLQNERFSDVKLEGTDGIQVDANRWFLSGRSAVFDKLLCGVFQEAGTSICKFPYSSDVLRAVVEYCYTDTTKILEDGSASAMTIVSLVEAADYFELDGLVQKAKMYVLEACSNISLAFEYFQACKTFGTGAADAILEIEEKALGTIRRTQLREKDMEDLGKVLASIDSSVLECILKDNKMQATEFSMFRLLKVWADAPGVVLSQQRKAARQLVHHIRLENISPTNLTTFAEQSGLVTSDQVMEACFAQGPRLDRPIYKKFRYWPPPAWAESQTTLLSSPNGDYFADMLNSPPMKTGIHVWKLQLEHFENYGSPPCEVGVIMSHELDKSKFKFIFEHRHGWSLLSNGKVIYYNAEQREIVHQKIDVSP